MTSVWTIKIWQLISIVCSALVAGMFHGPWAALSRSMRTFTPEVFLAIVDRMNRNMAPLMTVLMPATLLSIVPVLFLSYRDQRKTFYLNAIALALFIIALLVTVLVEVPIVEKSSPGRSRPYRRTGSSFVTAGENRKRNRRSLHCAPPDFLLRPVALMNCVRLSLRRAAYVVVASSAK